MKHALVMTVFLYLAGCCERGPEVLRHTDLRQHVVVESAGPIDPHSILFAIHADSRVTWNGESLSVEQIIGKVSPPPSDLNSAPVLLDVDPLAGFDVVRDILAVLTGKGRCCNISFLVACPGRMGALVLPVVLDRGLGYRVRDGQAEEQFLDGRGPKKHLELIVSPGKEGAIDVRAVNYCVPGEEDEVYFPPAGEKPARPWKAPDYSWTGERPPNGRWTPDTLGKFLARQDVAELSPFILLKITTQEKASDVLQCLSMLKSVGGAIIVPEIPTRR